MKNFIFCEVPLLCFHPYILCESQARLRFYLFYLCFLSVFPCFCFSVSVLYIYIYLHGILCYLLHWKPFKNDEKCFLFHLKSSFRSQDTYVFVIAFWSCRKNGLIRKIRLTVEFMASHHNLINKQLQYTYWPISHEVKAIRQWNLVS